MGLDGHRHAAMSRVAGYRPYRLSLPFIRCREKVCDPTESLSGHSVTWKAYMATVQAGVARGMIFTGDSDTFQIGLS